MHQDMHLTSLRIQGFRPFRDTLFQLEPLVVFVGANGSGKSSLFEFLRFLRTSSQQEIPPEIVAGAMGGQVFHLSGSDFISWAAEVFVGPQRICYDGGVQGPVGKPAVTHERVRAGRPDGDPFTYMDVGTGKGVIRGRPHGQVLTQDISLRRTNQLALSIMVNPAMTLLYELREYISGWRFYSAFNIATGKIRRSVVIEQEPMLHEDAGNLSSVLHYFQTEHPETFDELQQILRTIVPGFRGLRVKARGGPGEVIAFWKEEGVDEGLTLADVSDGIVRLLCWAVLCLHPKPPSLICIDEPDQGVHPRTLPVLAGLFEKAADRTQIFLATHASYFLMQFDLDRLAVMRKENGEAICIRPGNSKTLRANLKEFGPDEVEIMHRSDELEHLA